MSCKTTELVHPSSAPVYRDRPSDLCNIEQPFHVGLTYGLWRLGHLSIPRSPDSKWNSRFH